MKKFNAFLTLMLAVLVGKFALANRHTFATDGSHLTRPATIDTQMTAEFQTATFALG